MRLLPISGAGVLESMRLPCLGAALLLTATPAHSQVVISQVYATGGTIQSTFTHDFVQLFNRGSLTVNVTGWTVAYRQYSAEPWSATTLSGAISPGRFHLIRLAGNPHAGSHILPEPDTTGSTNLMASGTVVLSDVAGNPEDVLGYGPLAPSYEGTAYFSSLTSGVEALRRSGRGCLDTDDNSLNFWVGPAFPSTSRTPASPCETTIFPPGALGKSAPEDGDATSSVAPSLSWIASVGATEYHVRLCPTPADGPSCYAAGPFTATSSAAPTLTAGTTYYWQVQARNGSGTTFADAGTWWSFHTPGVVGPPVLNPISAFLKIGGTNTLTGTNFTAGTVIKLFIATASGPASHGPFTPASWTSTSLNWQLPQTIPLSNGFGTVQLVATDRGYLESNLQGALLEGDAADNIPTLLTLNGATLGSADPSIGVAHIDTVLAKGALVTIAGTGFNNPGVNLHTARGNVGPLWPLPGGTATQIQVYIPVDAPTGAGNFQVVNAPYSGNVQSNAVSAAIGARPAVTSVGVSGTTVTVQGAGFCSLSVINLYNWLGGSVVNLGGLAGAGPRIPLVIVSDTEFTFTIPPGAVSGAAFVDVLNPPFIPFSASGADPDGAFTIP